MEQHKDVTLLAPLVHNPDGTIQQSLRTFPTFRTLFFELSGLSRVFPSSKILNEWRMPDFDYKTIADVDQPMGAALFVRKGFFSDTFIDEQFSMFFNDVDLCKRIKKEGGKILFYPDASIIHERGKSTARVKERMIPLHTKGFIQYFAKHNRSFFDTLLLTFFVPIILLHTMLRVFLFRFFSKDF
ncbi:MAG: hypothetical protein E3J78_05815 [Candidatus Cloacimonadota bacterium]|nr:MAG: hypothetical protein E3J78_05815 [Candidatus Cloacimonadota bacterium]